MGMLPTVSYKNSASLTLTPLLPSLVRMPHHERGNSPHIGVSQGIRGLRLLLQSAGRDTLGCWDVRGNLPLPVSCYGAHAFSQIIVRSNLLSIRLLTSETRGPCREPYIRCVRATVKSVGTLALEPPTLDGH